MATPKQVQLRGGTSEEHNSFVGAPREITIDTTNNTIRVHDGKTFGGYAICRVSDLITVNNDLTQRIDDMQNNLGGSHNHDDRYALKTHNHDDRYYKKLSGGFNVCSKVVNGYHGLCDESGNDQSWYRTTTSGLLPYKSGGYSSIGSRDWKFNEGWFNTLNASNTYCSGGVYIGYGSNGQYSSVRFASQGSNKRIEYDANADRLYVAGTKSQGGGLSDMEATVFHSNNYAMVSGTRLYIQSSDPGNVPNGSVWIKI